MLLIKRGNRSAHCRAGAHRLCSGPDSLVGRAWLSWTRRPDFHHLHPAGLRPRASSRCIQEPAQTHPRPQLQRHPGSYPDEPKTPAPGPPGTPDSHLQGQNRNALKTHPTLKRHTVRVASCSFGHCRGGECPTDRVVPETSAARLRLSAPPPTPQPFAEHRSLTGILAQGNSEQCLGGVHGRVSPLTESTVSLGQGGIHG